MDKIFPFNSRIKKSYACYFGLVAVTFIFIIIYSESFIKDQTLHQANGLLRKTLGKLYSLVIESTEETKNDTNANWTGCLFPQLDPFDPFIVKIAQVDRAPVSCASGMPDLTYLEGNRLIVNKSMVSKMFLSFNVSCKYQDILRQNNRDNNFFFSEVRKTFTDSIQLPPDTEFILVVCEGISKVSSNMSTNFSFSNMTKILTPTGIKATNVPMNTSLKTNSSSNSNRASLPVPTALNVSNVSDNKISKKYNSSITNTTPVPTPAAPTILSRKYFTLIPRHDFLNEFESLRLQKRAVEFAPKETMNVIMIGFDSVSRYSFLRAMSRTHSYLVNDLMSFDMTMHSQVGKNSFPNFLALMTGAPEMDTQRWWKNRAFSDDFDIIWKDFEKVGYRTMFSEDVPHIGIFNYYSKGFYKVPTIYYNKAISFAIEKDPTVAKAGRHCVGNQPEVLFHLEYLKRLLDLFSKKPLFALIFMTRIAHDEIRQLKSIDEHVLNFYKQLNSSGHLNNTMLITFSDHGIRFGPLRHTYMGDVEFRTPFLTITVPSWFLKKYPDVAENLKTNTRRLTSHFDTHATMQDMLYFKPSTENPLRSKHGISLFKEIPKNRTCLDASIPQDFCLCDYQNSIHIDNNSAISANFSEVAVNYINSLIDQKQCHNLTVNKIIEVLLLYSVDQQSTSVKVNLKLKIETVPGNGVFESVVQALTIKEVGKSIDQLTFDQFQNVTVGKGIDRLNMYGNQSACTNNEKIKLFCYCKSMLKT